MHDNTPIVDERIRQLERIIDQLQSFIENQMGRWESVVSCAEEATLMRAQAGGLRKEVEVEKANWDREHGERIAKLQDESRMLEEAWKRIESEDRRLAAKEAIAQQTYVAAPMVVAGKASAPAEPRADQPSEDDLADSQDRIAAVQEFRKLSAEIANHAKRSR